tara:strand:+ start:5293 stop:6054 length:762 start_codon:yes stop_codon:yes gene_type:complete
MKKLISFCLYGDHPKYIMGFYKNIELKNQFYPNWDIILFYDGSVDNRHIQAYKDMGVIVREVSGCGVHPTAWRFLAFDEENVSRVIFRDADSRLSSREADAVKDWEISNKPLHIMRDHPNHHNLDYPIFAGMWGIAGRSKDKLTMLDLILQYQGGARDYTMEFDRGHSQRNWGTDQHFLRDCVYSSLGTEEHSLIHEGYDYMQKANSQKREYWSMDFPTARNDNFNFIGEIFNCEWDGSESRENYHKDIIRCT